MVVLPLFSQRKLTVHACSSLRSLLEAAIKTSLLLTTEQSLWGNWGLSILFTTIAIVVIDDSGLIQSTHFSLLPIQGPVCIQLLILEAAPMCSCSCSLAEAADCINCINALQCWGLMGWRSQCGAKSLAHFRVKKPAM